MLYDTKSFYCNIKDKVPHDQRNHVIYKTKSPGCNDCYIGKTERCFDLYEWWQIYQLWKMFNNQN